MVQEPTTTTSPHKQAQRGQALIEYALILVLVVMALVAAVAATGPALGNVFSNTVFNLVGITGTPQDLYARGGPTAFWMTVTYVAANPPAARVFPTGQPPLPSATPTNGPSPTPTQMTPSKTPTNTPTLPPTPTATDAGFNVPYIDSINDPVWWRVDSSAYLGGADWLGDYFPNTSLTAPADRSLYNQQIDPAYRFNLDFDWSNGSPLDSWLTDNFSIRFTRTIQVFGPNPLTLNFSLDSDDGSRLKIDGTTVIDYWSGHSAGNPRSTTQTLSVGTHTLVVEYYEATGNASLKLAISANKSNVAADVNKSGGSATCPWTQITGSQPNTLAYAWKENLPTVSNGFPQNMHCNLELRGYVDLNGVANPTMSFWDVWDFGSTTDTSVKLQLAQYAPYNPDLSGGPNWAAGTTINLHSAGKNYAWTRNEFAIPAPLQNKQVTWRFVMDSGAASSVRRWYLDDIRLEDGAPAKTFGVCTVNKYTCGNFWDLDNPNEKADFQTSGRWNLTNKTVASNDSGGPSMAWDISSVGVAGTNGKYAQFGSEQGASDNRIHFVAFNGQIDLRSIGADGSGGIADWEGDYGFPILSFYQAYGLEAGDSIAVQWTRDADTPGTPANWQTVNGSPIQSVGTTGSPISDTMKRYELQLKAIPNWNTQTFRLRFALIVNNNKESTGWYIDNIAIEREGLMKFGNYPFCDDAESDTDQWLMGGQWGIATTSGAFDTGNSFSDSPGGNYVEGQVTSMTTRYAFDFNNDTPENLTNWGGNHSCFDGSTAGGKALHPVMTFWHWRKLGSSKSFRIELFRSAHAATSTAAIAPVAVWTYTYTGGSATQVVWEREELDVRAAVEKATGVSWATLTSNPDKYDDDFYLQFTFDALSGSGPSDGIYIDNIVMQEYSESSFKLWGTGTNYVARVGAPAAGNGNGTNWVDDIDNPDDWYNRWTTGGTWTSVGWDAHSGFDSLHNNDTSGQAYLHQSFNVLEMNKILDLRGATSANLPTMYFWTHYSISTGDSIWVEVAAQDETEMTTVPAPRNRMGYDYQYLWGSTNSYTGGSANSSWTGASSWEQVWTKPTPIGSTGGSRNDAWTRQQIDLRNYAGKRIKVRFVLNAYSDPSVGTGWWIDDVQFVFRTNNVFTVGFTDKAQNMKNWVAEGRWGLAPDQWRGSGGGPADLGTNPWNVYWFDCITWVKNPTQPGPNSSYLNQDSCSSSNWDNFFNKVTRTVAGTDGWISARPSLVSGLHYIKDFTDIINYDFGSDGRPGTTNDTWYDQYGGRFLRTINVTGGQYTFITTSDDGVRVRVETSTGAVPNGFPSNPFWNVINNWTSHGRTVNYQAVTLDPGSYQVVVEYYEINGDALMQLQVGTNKFSFSDSPKAGAAAGFPVVNSIPFSDSSLILDGVINLNIPAGYTTAQWKPRLEYYELFNFNSNGTTNGAVQVSTDGGFTWTQTGLSDTSTCPAGLDDTQCDPTQTAPYFGISNLTPQNGYDWLLKSHDLDNYVNQNIGLRFKLHTGSSTKDGWWLTDIAIGNAAG